MPHPNQPTSLGLREYIPNQSHFSIALPCTVLPIRTSQLIKVMLCILYLIYSISFNLSIKPNPTVLRLLQPQLYSYSARYGHLKVSTYTSSIVHMYAPASPHRVVLSFMALLATPTHTTLHTHCYSPTISLHNTYRHKTYCSSEHFTDHQLLTYQHATVCPSEYYCY